MTNEEYQRTRTIEERLAALERTERDRQRQAEAAEQVIQQLSVTLTELPGKLNKMGDAIQSIGQVVCDHNQSLPMLTDLIEKINLTLQKHQHAIDQLQGKKQPKRADPYRGSLN